MRELDQTLAGECGSKEKRNAGINISEENNGVMSHPRSAGESLKAGRKEGKGGTGIRLTDT